MRRSIERFVTGAALSLLAALPAVGQDSPLPELFSDVIDVRVVNVEAVVTDRKGNRIRGLQAGDFKLLVDGEPAPIAYFTEIDEGIVQAAPAGGVEIAEAMPSVNAGEPVGTNFLVFIDNFSSIRQHRDGLLRRLEGDLAQLGPADRVAAVASDGANVALLTGWTNSASEIREALRQARERPALGLMRRVDQRAIAQVLEQTGSPTGQAIPGGTGQAIRIGRGGHTTEFRRSRGPQGNAGSRRRLGFAAANVRG